MNVLDDDGIVRSDIRSSFGSSSGTAGGVPLTIDLNVVDAGTGAALEGAAVYLWHCDREGRYSLYSQGATDQNYLRGVQPADGGGDLSFSSIFPACYDGRWPHIHFEVYASTGDAVGGGRPLVTSQIALPEDICDAVYADRGLRGQRVQPVAGVAQHRHGLPRRRRPADADRQRRRLGGDDLDERRGLRRERAAGTRG